MVLADEGHYFAPLMNEVLTEMGLPEHVIKATAGNLSSAIYGKLNAK